jgi:PAS domain S-box-containing protein/excisionase family DNA binding protein
MLRCETYGEEEKHMADVLTAPRPEVGVLADATNEPGYYSISQAASLLGVSRVSIWRWIGAGLLPAARLGHRTIRIKREDLERALVQIEPAGSQSWMVEHLGTGGSAQDGAVSESEERVDWREIGASEHLVQFYETDAFLLDAVRDFIGAALRAGDAAIVIATEAHREGLEEGLQTDGLDLTTARACGRYVSLDAAETLARIMVDGEVAPARFGEVVGGIVTRAAASGRRVRIFGEMVALLTDTGDDAAAVRLEELWNDLQQTHAFALLCAYAMNRLGGEARADLVGEVCAAHSRVVPAESYAALSSPDDRLHTIAVLQQKAQSLEAEIAERKRAEQELRRTEAQLRDFFEQAVVGLHWVGADGTILWANQAELDLLGYSAEEYIGHHIAEFHADQEVIADILRRLTTRETLSDYEARLRCKDGAIKHVLIHSNVLWDGDTFVHTRCITVDITARKLAERRLAVQYEVTHILSEAETLAEAVTPILQCVCETLDWEVGAIWSADWHAGVLRCDEFWHVPSVDITEFDASSRWETFAPGVGLPGRVWASGQPIWLPDVLAADNFLRAPYAGQSGLHAAFGFPIRCGNAVLGVIEFFSREIRQPDADLLALMTAVGGQIGQFIERKRAEEIRFQLAAIVESSEDTIIGKYLDGIIFSWNTGAERMYGYSAEEVIGRSVALLIPPDMPDELPGILDRLRRGERIERYETVRIRKDGRRIDVALTISPIKDAAGTISGAATIARDITKRKREEAALRFLVEASSVLATTLDYEMTLQQVAQLAAPHFADRCSVFIVAEDGTIRPVAAAHADPSKEAQPGDVQRRARLDLAGPHPVAEVIRTSRSVFNTPPLDTALASAAQHIEHSPYARALTPTSQIIVPLIARQQVIGALAFERSKSARLYDAADLVLAEEVARRAALAVDNARLYREAQEAVRVRDAFLAIASHELKNPLTALLGNIQLLQRRATREADLTPERVQRSLQVAADQATRLNQMIAALLDISRLEGGQLTLTCAPLDLCALVRKVVAEVQPTLTQHTLTCATPDAPLIIEGDALRLEQVLQNLIGNAIKYSPRGGLVSVRIERQSEWASVDVSDQGIGIPQDALAKLFERFYRASNVDGGGIAGIGVGLYVVKEIVTLHGGKVAVMSQEGEGSTFSICLPLERAE